MPGATKTRLSKAALANVEGFNSGIRTLVSKLAEIYPDDAMVYRIRKRINLALDVDPLFIVNITGPQLLRYSEKIYAKDFTFFVANDYDAELKESVDAGRMEAAAYLIPKVKESAVALPEDERKKYMEVIVDMLDNYIDFVAERHGIA